MSEREGVERSLVAITITFQNVLNLQLKKIMDAIDTGNHQEAYTSLKTLITTLRPEDSDLLIKNDLAHIDGELGRAGSIESVDLVQTGRKRRRGKDMIYRTYVRDLFLKVMRKLHEGGYLEKTRKIQKGRFGQ